MTPVYRSLNFSRCWGLGTYTGSELRGIFLNFLSKLQQKSEFHFVPQIRWGIMETACLWNLQIFTAQVKAWEQDLEGSAWWNCLTVWLALELKFLSFPQMALFFFLWHFLWNWRKDNTGRYFPLDNLNVIFYDYNKMWYCGLTWLPQFLWKWLFVCTTVPMCNCGEVVVTVVTLKLPWFHWKIRRS